MRVSAPDVQGLFAWWLGDDVSRVWRVASRYYLSDEEAALLYGARRRAAGGRRRASAAPAAPRAAHRRRGVDGSATFELWLDGALLEAKANPYGFIPFVIYPNLREPKQFWGVSDIDAVREPVRELNRALSQLSMILELSGNPVAVLENVTEAQDIAVQPGAVWELPERARAYLLDLLQGGGVNLHVDYVNLVYRTLHDLGESPRTSFGDNGRGLSGVALNIELDPLLKKVQRKRLLREAAFKRRNEMVLRLLEQYTGVELRALPLARRLGPAAAGRPQPARRGRDAPRRRGHPLAPPRRRRAGRGGPGRRSSSAGGRRHANSTPMMRRSSQTQSPRFLEGELQATDMRTDRPEAL